MLAEVGGYYILESRGAKNDPVKMQLNMSSGVMLWLCNPWMYIS